MNIFKFKRRIVNDKIISQHGMARKTYIGELRSKAPLQWRGRGRIIYRALRIAYPFVPRHFPCNFQIHCFTPTAIHYISLPHFPRTGAFYTASLHTNISARAFCRFYLSFRVTLNNFSQAFIKSYENNTIRVSFTCRPSIFFSLVKMLFNSLRLF